MKFDWICKITCLAAVCGNAVAAATGLKCQKCVFERYTSTVPELQKKYAKRNQGDFTCMDGVEIAEECSKLKGDDYICHTEKRELRLTKTVDGREDSLTLSYVERGCTGRTWFPGFGDNTCRNRKQMLDDDFLSKAEADALISNRTARHLWPGARTEYDDYEFCLCDYNDCNGAALLRHSYVTCVTCAMALATWHLLFNLLPATPFVKD